MTSPAAAEGPFVLIVHDYNSVNNARSVWGPYANREDAQTVWAWLQEIGVEGMDQIAPLRSRLPLTRVEQLERDVQRQTSLAGHAEFIESLRKRQEPAE